MSSRAGDCNSTTRDAHILFLQHDSRGDDDDALTSKRAHMNTPSQADMSQGINPAFLSGGFNGGNPGANGAPQGLTPQQIQQMQAMRSMGGQGGGSSMGINPAMFQQGGGGGGQGGMGGGGMGGGTMNPAASSSSSSSSR
ncbi:hypothetical protein L227DRAFT_658892 [Lentinus tigrinus ALCF2SS1-6]|uniref:Uncharacterized protein n=1 Tax=Lentinus tigrinus ALCF2SS1-6 TaxID=1328759 RepID=A0A5C2RM78_9APHY|nr:hypothetical protein L227DRAFT_658892 [Lentinus tigrinus ALCF2SS1-6]